MRDAADQIVVAPDRQTAVDVEGGARLAAIGFLYAGIPRIGQDKKPLSAFLQRLFERRHKVRGLRALGGLPEFEFNGLGSAFPDGVFRHALRVVVIVGLKDDLPVSPVILVEGVQHFPEFRGVDDLAVFVGKRRVLAYGSFADDRVDASHGRAAEVVGPVELDERGEDDRQRQLHGVEGADLPFEPHMVDGGAIGVQRSPHCPERSAVDVEMGIIDGIDLFRGDLVFPRGGGIYGLHAPDGGQADLAAADAVGGAHGAHAGKRTDMGRIAHFCAVEHGAEGGAVRHGRFPP